jgi:ribosomal protein S18 acetylase RimI-like enzyme
VWPLRSSLFRTDVFLTAFDGEVHDRGRYLVLRTPTNPTYHWGNFLLYPDPPTADAFPTWLEDHARELPEHPHVILSWDRPEGVTGETDAFVRAGFEVDDGVVLSATKQGLIRSKRVREEIAVAPLETDAHWEEASRVLTNAFAERRTGSLDDLHAFVVRQLERYRAMQSRGLGQWYGAYVDGAMASTLGLVRVDASELGRFQLVGTDPRFANRGACSTLLYEVARRALEEQGFETLVLAADGGYHAVKVYESVGFRPTERLFSLMRKAPRV